LILFYICPWLLVATAAVTSSVLDRRAARCRVSPGLLLVCVLLVVAIARMCLVLEALMVVWVPMTLPKLALLGILGILWMQAAFWVSVDAKTRARWARVG